MDTANLNISNATEQIMQYKDLMVEYVVTFGSSVLGAIGILILGWMVSSWAQRSVRKALGKTDKIDVTLKPLIASVVRYVIMIFVLVAVLAQFGVQTASIITVLGAAGLAIGLSLQGTLANIAAGVMLLILRPLRVGEFVDVEGVSGTIEEVGLFTTIMKTFDGVFVSVPNSQIWGKSIKNYSRNPDRRVDVTVGIAYDDDVEKGMKVLLDFLKKDKRVYTDPEPQTMVNGLGDSSVNINMRAWCSKEDYWNVYFDLHRDAKLLLDKKGFSIPFPQRDVHVFDMGKPKKK